VTIRFVEEAQREFLDAISDYEEARAGQRLLLTPTYWIRSGLAMLTIPIKR
jgi:hypothetical protein